MARGGETVLTRAAVASPRAGADIALVVSVSRAGGDDRTKAHGVLAVAWPEHAPAPALAEARAEIATLRRLVTEVQRASRDTLAIIRSIARRTGAGARSVSDYADHLDGRIAALARVQTALARNPAGVNLALLLGDTLMAAGARETREFTLDGPELPLSGKRAKTLGLAFHELTTNAVKYGALARRGGRIAIDWRVNRDDPARPVLEMDWVEFGVPPTNATGSPGFGAEFFDRTMSYEIDARVRRRLGSEGLIWHLCAPLAPESDPLDAP